MAEVHGQWSNDGRFLVVSLGMPRVAIPLRGQKLTTTLVIPLISSIFIEIYHLNH